MSGDDRDAKEAAKQAYNFCERQNAHGLKMLFKKNAAARVDGFINGQGRNGLHTCSARGDLAVVKQILKSKRADVNTQDSGWNTAVMLAAETGK
jgi:ankyrin repeat protein